MDVVSINGVEYTKAAKLAKQFKYTSDYVGQLCRGRKVDAKLVGRTWYVSERSLTDHKLGRHAVLRSGEKTIDIKPEIDTRPVEVARPLDKKTLRSLPPLNAFSHFARHIEWKPVKYEADDSDLFPALKPPVRIPVGIAEATTLKIKSQERPTALVADSLPEVSLRGTLTVGSLDDDFEINEENIAISELPLEAPRAVTAETALEFDKIFKPKRAPQAAKNFTYGVKIRHASALDQVASASSPLPMPEFAPARLRGALSKGLTHDYQLPDGAKANSTPRSSVVLYTILVLIFLLLSSAVIFLDLASSATASTYITGVSVTPISALKF